MDTLSPFTKNQILHDLEATYQQAFANGKWQIALRAKEMQAKILGLFKPQRLPDVVRIADMTPEQFAEFVDRLEDFKTEPEESEPAKPKVQEAPQQKNEVPDTAPLLSSTSRQGMPQSPTGNTVPALSENQRPSLEKGDFQKAGLPDGYSLGPALRSP